MAGLENFGNTCFANSALQLIFASKTFKDLISEHATLGHFYNASVGTDTRRHLKLWKHLKELCPQFADGRQHDAHELLMVILDVCDTNTKIRDARRPRKISFNGLSYEEILKESGNTFFLEDLKNTCNTLRKFNGQYRSTVTCKKCCKERNQWDLFTCLSIYTNTRSVKDYIAHAATSEVIENYECEKCKCRRSAIKNMEIWSLPEVLIFQVLTKGLQQLCLTVNIKDRFGVSRDYSLKSICFHEGQSFESGHYYAAVKNDRGWWLCNDSFCMGPIDPKKEFPNKIGHVYILLYEC